MQLPDYADGLRIAARLLEVERDEIELVIRGERLHQAILVPATCKGGAPVYRTPGEITKCLLVECACGEILPNPKNALSFGWLMAQRAIELSGYRWRPQGGDEAQLAKFAEQLQEGIDPGKRLTRWMEDRIDRVANGPREEEADRALHVTSPMHPAPSQDMVAWANAVDDGLTRFLETRESPEVVSTRRPQIYPAHGNSPEEIYGAIEKRLHTADGLVVLAPQGSWGAAIELEIALRGLIPALFVHPADAPPGDRVRVRLESMEATIRKFDDGPDDAVVESISELVCQWLEDAYPRVLGAHRRRLSVQTRLSRMRTAVAVRKTQISRLEERRALAAAGLPEARAKMLIEEPWGLQFASVTELIALSNAYRVPANIDGLVPEPPTDRPPYLTALELKALEEVVENDRISGPEAIKITAAGQREVALAGRRRKLFTDWRAWRDMRNRMHRGQ